MRLKASPALKGLMLFLFPGESHRALIPAVNMFRINLSHPAFPPSQVEKESRRKFYFNAKEGDLKIVLHVYILIEHLRHTKIFCAELLKS